MTGKKTWRKKGQVFAYNRTSWHINQAYYYDKFFAMTVEGVQRVGKSSYASQCLAEAFGEWTDKPEVKCVEPDYEAVKDWMVFLPREFLDLVLSVGKKERGVIWDDAGFWLFALDWYEPFVKSVSRYIQLCGRQFGALIMTTPDKVLISSKVLAAMPKMKICQITEIGVDSFRNRPRRARVYEKWNWADGKRGGVRRKWQDNFNAMLPDSYFDWYHPKSESYMIEGLKILRREVLKMQSKLDKKAEAELMEDVHKLVGGDDKINELNEVIANLETIQVSA